MPKCFYCGRHYDNPRGLTLVMNDGTARHLCSSKCRRNMKMKRRNVRWISKQKLSKEDVLSGDEELLESVPSAPAKGKEKKEEPKKEDNTQKDSNQSKEEK